MHSRQECRGFLFVLMVRLRPGVKKQHLPHSLMRKVPYTKTKLDLGFLIYFYALYFNPLQVSEK